MALWGLLPDTIGINVVLIGVTTALIWIGSGWLEDSAEGLATHYGIPPVIQGSVIVAIGSSFPEFASVIVTAAAGVFDMGIGTIVGSAIFNILAIPALSGLAADNELDTNRELVYKEAQFYMIAVSALTIVFALAVIYAPVETGSLSGEITRIMAVIPLLLYAMYLFIQWQDIGDYDAPTPPADFAVKRGWARLAGGLIVIAVTIQVLVDAVDWLRLAAGIPEFLAGVLIISAVTSIPDTLVSVRAAQEDRGLTSVGNVLGSNTFNLLVAIPVGVLLVGGVTVNFAVAAPMMGVLTVATMLLFTLLRTEMELTQVESGVLMGGYLLFVVWMIAETIGLIDILATI